MCVGGGPDSSRGEEESSLTHVILAKFNQREVYYIAANQKDCHYDSDCLTSSPGLPFAPHNREVLCKEGKAWYTPTRELSNHI